MMESLIIRLAWATLLMNPPLAFDDGKSAEVHEVKVKDQLNLNGGKILPPRQRNIHRIKTLAAYERMGGKKALINFDKMDLVIVNGWLGCAEGKVEIETEKQTAIFSVKIVHQCNHLEAILCMKPYVGISRSAKIWTSRLMYSSREKPVMSVTLKSMTF